MNEHDGQHSDLDLKSSWDLLDGDGIWIERFATKQEADDEAERLTLKYDLDIWDPWTREAKYPWYKVVSVVPDSENDTIDRTQDY